MIDKRHVYGRFFGLDARLAGFILGPLVGGAIFGYLTIGHQWTLMLLGAIYAYPLALVVGAPVFFWIENKRTPLIACLVAGAAAGALLWVLIMLLSMPSPFGDNWYKFRAWFYREWVIPVIGMACGLIGGFVLYLCLRYARIKPVSYSTNTQ